MVKKWEPDKWKHFYVGIPLGIILQAATIYFFSFQPFNSALIAFAALIIICYGFELFSLVTGKGHYESMDAVAGAAGGGIGIAITWVFIALQHA